MTAEVFFLPCSDTGESQRLCIYHPAHAAKPTALIVYVHPFAEEMNKSRRMAALQSRAFASAGCSVLQIDLLGCGDSSGDFEDATWQAWLDDVVHACHWMQKRADAPLWLWGLRAGCLLAAEAAVQLGMPCNFLFWQPSISGKPVLQQFMRLKLAGDMAAGKGIMGSLRQQLADGKPVEIAGYTLGADLANGLEPARLTPPPGAGRVEWIEVSARENASLLPTTETAVESWRACGWDVRTAVADGPSFWQTVEIEEAPSLVALTLGAMRTTEAAVSQ